MAKIFLPYGLDTSLDRIFPSKTGEYPRIFPSFQNFEPREKDLRDNKHNSLNLGRNYARIFVLGHYLFLGAHVFLELRSWKTVRFSEERMSEDKINVVFSRQIEPIVYISVFFLLQEPKDEDSGNLFYFKHLHLQL